MDIYEKTEKGFEFLRGTRIPIALDAWFTSEGEIMIRLFKWVDDEGITHTEKNVHVLSHENFLDSILFRCRVVANNASKIVKIAFDKNECKWTIII